jgi:uncharacterized protein YkwD
MSKLKQARKWIANGVLGLVLVFALLCIIAVITKPADQPTPSSTPSLTQDKKINPSDIDKLQLDDLVNSERAAAGLNKLKTDPALADSASEKCNDMVTRNYWDHKDPDGNMPWIVVQKHYGSYRAVGENLSYGTLDADETVKDWMASPTHKENILNPTYQDVGYAVCYSPKYVDSKERLIVVQHFASKV